MKDITLASLMGILLAVFILMNIDAEVARAERATYGSEQTKCLFDFNCKTK